ncbi:hypothetical protein NVSP9465_01493 [Novosphingobium sp. CECT 9465]|nr:hypothetical protein NVSP9465_01493 [Novosphingobium sp. CECT 9465]
MIAFALLATSPNPAAAQNATPSSPVGAQDSRPAASATDGHAQAALFGQALDIIRQNYNGPVDPDGLTSTALKAMAGSLDGHSVYMTPQEFKDFQAGATGEFAGIGTVIEVADGKLRVIAPTDAGPAARAGVGAGWFIRSIDGQTVERTTLIEATRRLRGTAGTTVAITFIDGSGHEVPLVLTRETIHLHSVYQRRIGSIGYVHITGFAQVTDRELGEAQADLLKAGPMTGLILDLRNNTGGFIDAAVHVASRFLQPGAVVVRTGKSASATTAIVASDQGEALRRLPVVVLINGGSASASEIVAAALQDNHRASLIGLVTFGKGLVQNIFPLAQGAQGALSVTTMRYYTPSGRSIQRIGVTPDLVVARTAREAEAAVKGGQMFTEASVFNAPDNEMQLKRDEPDTVEGPVDEGPQPDKPLFAKPLPDDADIAADFQILRALDVLRANSPDGANPARAVRLYRRPPPEARAVVNGS